jgi:hypothetical protein
LQYGTKEERKEIALNELAKLKDMFK